MRTVKSFEDLIVWQESMELAEQLILSIREIPLFSLRDQIIKSAISIPSNISEGFEKQRLSNKEFIRFLYIAKGSAGELKTQLLLLSRLDQIYHINCDDQLAMVEKIIKMLGALINTRYKQF